MFDRAVRHIFNKNGFTPEMLAAPEISDLIEETYNAIDQAVQTSIRTETPPELTHALENNAFVFSGFKTYHQLSEVGLSLTRSDGSVKPFKEFHEDVEAINSRYNGSYLYAEYNHAIHASQMAVKWNDFVKDGDEYYLQYRTAGDDRVREAHARLDGTTLPPSDPFWNEFLPPNGWNCRCQTVQVLRDDYALSDSQRAIENGRQCTSEPKQQMFRFNPGKEMKIFPPKHPYYKAPKAAKHAVEELTAERETEYMRRRVKEIREYMADHLTDPLVNEGLASTAYMSSRSVKEFTNQPHKHKREKNELLMNIQKVYESARYLGINPNYIKPGIVASHILEIELCGEKSWLVVREYTDGSLNLYSCSDNPRIATGLVKK